MTLKTQNKTNHYFLDENTAQIQMNQIKLLFLLALGQKENNFILETNFQTLIQQNEDLKKKLQEVQTELKIVTQELLERRKQEQIMEEIKQKRRNRKRLPSRQPITDKIYETFIVDSKNLQYSKSYRGARLRLALALLAITGCRVSELLPLKIQQVETLFEKQWITINRAKRGPANHKAFLTKKGAQIIKDRYEDFDFIKKFKEKDSFIFTSENSNKPLKRESFTALINKFIQTSGRRMEGQPVLSSHSFRIGFITQLWRDTNDIEFVKQAIGHVNIETTSQYIQKMPEQDIQKRMLKIN